MLFYRDNHFIFKPDRFNENKTLYFEGKPIDKEKLKDLVKKRKPQQLIQYLSSDALRSLEVGTPAWLDWKESISELNTANSLSGSQIDKNIEALKSRVLEDTSTDLLDDDQIQNLLCEITRNFIVNIKREFGDILLAFSNRLINLFSILGYEDPELGVNVLIRDNSYYVCSELIEQLRKNGPKPDVYEMEFKRKEREKKQGRKRNFGISERLQTKIKKIFKEEIVLNPEDAFYLDDNDEEVEDVAREILLNDLVIITQAESIEDKSNNTWTVFSSFRLQKGSSYNNFKFGLKIKNEDDNSFKAVYFMSIGNEVRSLKSRLP